MDLAGKDMLETCINRSAHRCLLKYEKPTFNPNGFRELRVLRNADNLGLMESHERIAAVLWDWRDKVARKEDESLHYVMPVQIFREIVLAAHDIRHSDNLLRVARRVGSFDGLKVLESYAEELAELVSDALNAKDVTVVNGQLTRTNEGSPNFGGKGDSCEDVATGPSSVTVPKKLLISPKPLPSAMEKEPSLLVMKESSLFMSDVIADSRPDDSELQKPSVWVECYQAIMNTAQTQFSSAVSTNTEVADETKPADSAAPSLHGKHVEEPSKTDVAVNRSLQLPHHQDVNPNVDQAAKPKAVTFDNEALPLSLAEKYSKKAEVSLKSKKRKQRDTEECADNVEAEYAVKTKKDTKEEIVPVTKKVKDGDASGPSIFHEPFDLGLEPQQVDEKQFKGSVRASVYTKRQTLGKANGGKYNPFGKMMEDRKRVVQGKVRPASGLRTYTYKPTGKK
mmetsp:Transcript_20742/g.35712  ORF Transcript_20742/g.35712 Transcript_20742/m.35712 type:complete len:452 (+) Transcript_20742:2-1357(+)